MGGSASLTLGADTATPAPAPTSGQPPAMLDVLGYGSPAPLGLDPTAADRSFEYAIGRRAAFLDGVPGLWWTINGHLYPDVPMFVVEDGDVVRMQISNNSGDVHPMHLHGHHAVVLSRNGVAATGSPWWIDSLNVADGESYEIAFRADNPGIWMDHCHNLSHPSEGLVTHLMYAGVTEPYLVGGPNDNEPE
jgi:FtsP/CotA-like multicopper oxidase with cupredoxin domain